MQRLRWEHRRLLVAVAVVVAAAVAAADSSAVRVEPRTSLKLFSCECWP